MGLLRAPRLGSSLRQSQTFHGEADGSEEIDGPDLDDDFFPPYASHSPQGPARNQGSDEPAIQQTKVDRQDASEHAIPENDISADENVDESTFIPLISPSDYGIDDTMEPEIPRIKFSFDEGSTITRVPQLPVLAPPNVFARRTLDETGGHENKEDTSMTDVPVDGDDSVKIDRRMEQ